jgi:hypothetical protein
MRRRSLRPLEDRSFYKVKLSCSVVPRLEGRLGHDLKKVRFLLNLGSSKIYQRNLCGSKILDDA